MTDTTRDAFEAEANRQEMDLNRFEQGYSDCNTDYGWLFWQAATLAELEKNACTLERMTERKRILYAAHYDELLKGCEFAAAIRSGK